MPTGKITALRAQANDTQRVNLFIDESFALGISLTTLARERLFVGMAIDEPTWERIASAEDADRAFSAGMRLIEYRLRSVAELEQRLQRKGFAPPAIAAAIERLEQIGLLNDAVFSQAFAEQRSEIGQRGSRVIRAELRRKGIAADAIEAAVAELSAPEAERERAEQLARQLFRRYANEPDRQRFVRRLGGALQRRGFRYEIVGPILARLWAERGGEDDESDEANETRPRRGLRSSRRSNAADDTHDGGE